MCQIMTNYWKIRFSQFPIRDLLWPNPYAWELNPKYLPPRAALDHVFLRIYESNIKQSNSQDLKGQSPDSLLGWTCLPVGSSGSEQVFGRYCKSHPLFSEAAKGTHDVVHRGLFTVGENRPGWGQNTNQKDGPIS